MLFLFVCFLASSLVQARYFGDYSCSGRSDVILHLFEWKWEDIAAECERFLGPKEFCGVQVSPPQEHRVVDSPWRPWWQRYQPVSYILNSRSGDRNAFKSMIDRCHAAGIKVYVDAVFNHMTGGGSGYGSSGSWFDAEMEDYPSVPYSMWDFNHYPEECPNPSGEISDYGNVVEVRNCRLVGLRDLKLGKDYVQAAVLGYLNDLKGLGVDGFRVDAAKHMWPGDMSDIFNRLSDYPYIFMEVIDQGGEPIKATDYTYMGRITEFKYGQKLGEVIQLKNGQKLKYLKTFGANWGFLSPTSAVVFVDNHDNQRGHGGGGNVITHTNSYLYKVANAFMLSWDYGHVRLMSSYSFTNTDQGPPSYSDGSTKTVHINNDNTCGDGWVCEHRWRQIYNMVKFHNIAIGNPVSNWWDNGGNQIAFSRGAAAFIAINREGYDMNVSLYTGLSQGTYCDVISGDKSGSRCTGSSVTVDGSGRANIFISSSAADPIVAFHRESKL